MLFLFTGGVLFTWSGALVSSGILLPYPVIPLASPMTNILISTLILTYKHIKHLTFIFINSSIDLLIYLSTCLLIYLSTCLQDEALPLSVQGQVQRLIDEARAEENLAQMYIGWQPRA